MGLHALLLHLEARKPAARVGDRYVPLDAQDSALWDHRMIERAEALLKRASGFVTPGRFQIEAAIQSVHADRAGSGVTNWEAILRLYEALSKVAPSLGGAVAQAAALTLAGKPQEARRRLDALPQERLKHYQPYWAVRATLSQAPEEKTAARHAFMVAAGLSSDPAERRYLLAKRAALDP